MGLFYRYGIPGDGAPILLALVLVIAGAAAALARRAWVGGVAAGVLLMLLAHPRSILRVPMLLVVMVLLGLAAGVFGLSLRLRRPRMAAVSGLWIGAGLALLYLMDLTYRVHDAADLVFAGGLLLSILVVGSITVIALPPDGVPSQQQRPPGA